MSDFSYTKALLKHWNIDVEEIPTSDSEQKKEADFLTKFGNCRVLIEEKRKEDSPGYLSERTKELELGEIHTVKLPFSRNETLSGIIKNASHQLRSSVDKKHDFRLIWFTATGVNAKARYEQFIATLYGRTNIQEKDKNHYRPCYYFQIADFWRRADIVDGAVVAYTDGKSICAKLCLNSLSPRYEALRCSEVIEPFRTAVIDPLELEAKGLAFIADCAVDRKDEAVLLQYLQEKYSTAPLMNLNVGYLSATLLMNNQAVQAV